MMLHGTFMKHKNTWVLQNYIEKCLISKYCFIIINGEFFFPIEQLF